MMTIEEIQVRKECQTFDCKSIQIDPIRCTCKNLCYIA